MIGPLRDELKELRDTSQHGRTLQHLERRTLKVKELSGLQVSNKVVKAANIDVTFLQPVKKVADFWRQNEKFLAVNSMMCFQLDGNVEALARVVKRDERKLLATLLAKFVCQSA